VEIACKAPARRFLRDHVDLGVVSGLALA
jgi:hypothetical protein